MIFLESDFTHPEFPGQRSIITKQETSMRIPVAPELHRSGLEIASSGRFPRILVGVLGG